MEKSSKILLYPSELEEVKEGRLPQRISHNYALTLEELVLIINHDQYEIFGEN